MWRITFNSDKFLPYLPEDAQTAPGSYGFELAQWLSLRLAQCGISTGYPVPVDWGWIIDFNDDGTEIVIGCGSDAREGQGYSGEPLPWFISVRENLTLNQRVTGAGNGAKVRDIAEAVTWALATESIGTLVTEA